MALFIIEEWAVIDRMRAEQDMRSRPLRYFRRDCCNAGRVESTAHENCRRSSGQALATALLQELAELFDAFSFSLQPQALFDRQRCETMHVNPCGRKTQCLTGREAGD